MEIIEFLEKTDSKSFKNFVTFKVRQKISEYEDELKLRQDRLRDILTFENTQRNEEILMLFNERLEASHRQRMEWINTKLMEKESARQELLKLKRQQRELENCEEWRHMQTHQLLVATKEAQLYQIEAKKANCAKEQLIEQNWLKAMERLRQEKEFQQNYEAKLRKVVEGSNQQTNLNIHDQCKKQQQMENDALRKEYQEDNMRSLALDQKCKTDEKLREIYKKMQQGQWLKSQIKNNYDRHHMENQQKSLEDLMYKDREDFQIYKELDETERAKVRNHEWQKLYLEHCIQEKQQRHNTKQEQEKIYLNTGCVLQQSQKRPYRRNCR